MAGAIAYREAGLERPRGGANDLRQPGARLNGIGDRLERLKIQRGRPPVRRSGHTTILRAPNDQAETLSQNQITTAQSAP